jgi:hypothetical protein
MKMPLTPLENLVRTGNLKSEPADQSQIDGMIKSAKARLADIEVAELSDEGKFSSAYGAAHALALAALRWHGYRSDKRYVVFQCLPHTVGLDNAKWRVLDQCHKLRNQAEYEGLLDISPNLLNELVSITKELLELVEGLGPLS